MRRARDDRRIAVASHPVRFHDHLSLPVPAVDDGAGPAHRGVQVARPAAPRRVVQRSRPLLGADLRPQLRHGRGDRHPDGVPVRHQLVGVLPLLRRGRRPGPGDGGPFRVLPRVDVPGAVPLRREAARPEGAPGGGRRPGAGLVALGLLHHRRQRLHAAPGRLPAGRGRGAPPREFPGLHLQPLGVVAIRPQHAGLARHGVVRRGRRGGLLVADGPARPARRDLPARGGHRGVGLQPAGRLPGR